MFTPSDTAGVEQLMALLIPNPPHIPAFILRDILRRSRENASVLRRNVASMTTGRDLLDFRLYALRQPLLVVWGEEDRLIPPSVGKTIHQLLPGSVFALAPGCGHLAPAQCAQPVLDETVAFLRAQPPLRCGETILPATHSPQFP